MTRPAAFGVRPISARNRLVRWRPLQPAEQGAELAGWLARIGVRRYGERLVQREDERQVGRRQAAVPGRRYPALAVAHVPGHVAAQRSSGDPAAVLVDHGLVRHAG